METHTRVISAILASGTAISLSVGCATKRDFVRDSLQANLVVEESSNQQMLLNILRAYKKRPMHFTTLQQIEGPAGPGVIAPSLVIPFGPVGIDERHGFPLTLGATFNQPTYTIAPLDKQEFQRGITTPLAVDTLSYYFDQAWPADLLMHVAFREIQLYDNVQQRVVSRVRNYPPEIVDFALFQTVANRLGSCWVAPLDEVPEDIGPPFCAAQLPEVEKLAGLMGDPAPFVRLASEPLECKERSKDAAAALPNWPQGFQLSRTVREPGLRFTTSRGKEERAGDCQCAAGILLALAEKEDLGPGELLRLKTRLSAPDEQKLRDCPSEAVMATRVDVGKLARPRPIGEESPARNVGVRDAEAAPLSFDILFGPPPATGKNSRRPTGIRDRPNLEIRAEVRSPEQMVYYLGEVVRAQLHPVRKETLASDGGSVIMTERCRTEPISVGLVRARPLLIVARDVPADWQRGSHDAPDDVSTESLCEGSGDGETWEAPRNPNEAHRSGPTHSVGFESAIANPSPWLQLAFEGEDYRIPSDPSFRARSSDVLTLVTQFIGLQKESSELPSSFTLRLSSPPAKPSE